MSNQNQPLPGAPGQPTTGNAPAPRGNAPVPRGNTPVDELAHTVANRETPRDPPLGTDGSSVRIKVAGHIGRYAVLRRLGEGGMGVVFVAYDEELDRKVAVKLLRDSGPVSPERRTRILREAQAMAKVSHPNVVNVYEVGEVDGQVFIAMEFVEGTTLSEWQSAGRRWEEILTMYIAAGEGLHAAHQAGLVHRDFKPDNVLVGSEGRPRVADFGLARSDENPALDEHLKKEAAEAAAASGQAPSVPLLRSPLTVAGTILGTPAYMSPEQHRGDPAGARSDQFSFCAALYEALYGTMPFAGETLIALSFNVLSGNFRAPPSRSPVPARISRALRRGLSSDPAARFPSMRELLTELTIDQFSDPDAVPWPRRLFTASMVLAVVVGAFSLESDRLRGTLTVRSLLLITSTLFCVMVIGAAVLRRSLMRNTYHRGLVKILIILLGQLVGVRLLALSFGFTVPQVMALDAVAMAAAAAVSAALYAPLIWGVTAISLAMAVGLARFPEQAIRATGVYYPIVAITFALLWSHGSAHDSRPRAPQQKRRLMSVLLRREEPERGQDAEAQGPRGSAPGAGSGSRNT